MIIADNAIVELTLCTYILLYIYISIQYSYTYNCLHCEFYF